MSVHEFRLTKPPAANHIYGFTSKGGFARSYITKKGREWFQTAALEIYQQKGKNLMLEGVLVVQIHLFTCRFQDIDGIIKPTLDLLQQERVIVNDVFIEYLKVKKSKVRHIAEEHLIVGVTKEDYVS